MSDAAAESRIYRRLLNAVYDLCVALAGDPAPGGPVHRLREGSGFPAGAVSRVNEIIRDTGHEFRLAQYAAPNLSLLEEWRVPLVWDAAFELRKSLGDSHRGWRIEPDREVDGLLRGSGYELRRAR